MKTFIVGQRWISESEPELGLGLIIEVESKTLNVLFPAGNVERRYGTQTAPLRRLNFQAGDEIRLQDNSVHKVESVLEEGGLFTYIVEGDGKYPEVFLSPTLSLSRPEERLFAGSIDSNELFKLRYDVMLNQRKLFISPVRGFLGARVSLIPHQFYVAREVSERPRPRVMLADEVGLGKTIEAGLILNRLILTGQAQRALIIVPDSLVYQWFVEMLKKFGLSFKTINQEAKLQEEINPFEEGQLFIASLSYLMQTPWLKTAALDSDWDMLIVDEAHQLRWSPEKESVEYGLVKTLSQKSEGLILLSATPEILGLSGHFARLQLLDPQRFHDYNAFLEETMGYQEISSIAKFLDGEKKLTDKLVKRLEKLGLTNPTTPEERKKTLMDLLDRHGTGRVYFRNTRKRMASFAEFFPKRILHAAPLKAASGKSADRKDFQTKLEWLADHLGVTKGDKTLLLCHDKDLVVMLETSLKVKSPAKVAAFHSEMPLLQRDRAAAWFADPEGAQLLLSTEIGSEGRNFEFAKHLVLFDLPKLPDLLEQRIGRLDRIGQKNDIHIHVPYLEDTPDELLFNWYHEGVEAFTTSPRGASELYATVRDDLVPLYHKAQEGNIPEKELKALIDRTKAEHQLIEEKLEDGQDRLVELNSYNEVKAMGFVSELKATDGSNELRDFMLALYERLGIDVEDLDGEIYFVRPGDNMYVPHFPGLPHEGISVTFLRPTALRRDDVLFLTWDHPMVLGAMELVQTKEMGNVTVATWEHKAREPFLFEGFYVLNCVADRKLQIEKWFPPTPLRILLNGKGQDLTTKISKRQLEDDIVNLPQEKRAQLREIPRDFVKDCLKKGKEGVLSRAKQYKTKFLDEMTAQMDAEIIRLKHLREVNPTVSLDEIKALESTKKGLIEAMNQAEISLDSFRLVL